MPQIKTLEGMASFFGMTPEVFINGLKALGVINKDGSPKKKLIDEGFFNPNGTIANHNGLKELLKVMLGM